MSSELIILMHIDYVRSIRSIGSINLVEPIKSVDMLVFQRVCCKRVCSGICFTDLTCQGESRARDNDSWALYVARSDHCLIAIEAMSMLSVAFICSTCL